MPPCTPACTPACGQADGCAGTCSSVDAGVPGVPVLDPEDGGELAVGVGEQATVSWSAASKADSYKLELYPVGMSCSDAGVAHCLTLTDLSYSFDVEAGEYYYQVTAVNDTCGVDEESQASATFSIMGVISGQVKSDPDNNAGEVGGICTLAGAPGIQPGGGSQVVVGGSYSGSVEGSGDYSVSAPTGVVSVVLVPGDSSYTCSCPWPNCTYSGIISPISGLDFFVTDMREAWFQGVGGNFHADGGNLTVGIPSSCSGVCEPYLITEDAGGTTGMVSYSSGLDLGDGEISEDGNNWQAQTSYQGLETGYNYFARILEDDPDGIEVWGGGEPADGETGVYKGDGVSRIIGGDWSVADGTIVVLLVPNDLVIDVDIDVAEGGFLAIISSGDITIGDEVTNVEGVYIADGAINTCESSECGNISGGETVADRQLVLEGIFAGWGGVGLGRDFGTTDNNTNPAELFVYRPDLQTNAYEYLLRPHFTWVEVAP